MSTDHQESQAIAALQEQLAREVALREQAEQSCEQAEAALQELRDQFQAVLDAVPGGVSWINSDLQYLGINSRLASTYNLNPKDFIGRPIGFLSNSPGFTEFVREFVSSDEQGASRELDMIIEDNRRTYLVMAQKYLLGQSAVFVGIDITERKQAEEKLFHEAFYDKLTGLPNRALYMERLDRALEHAKRRENYFFAVIFLDFDDFKLVNDSLGHMVGDLLLAAIARRLESAIRSVDTVARLGGDEFVILLDDIEGLKDATHIAERIQRSLTVPFMLNEQEIFTAVSIGIALNRSDYERPVDLLRDADTAMYRAKVQGRNRYEVFDRTMHSEVMQRLELETDLHRSLDQEDFLLNYQPIVHLGSGKISGFEALVRWQRPQRGFTIPADFIPCAEETGLIVRLDRWVLREACFQMKEWQQKFLDHAPLTMNVNLSSRQFTQPDLVDYIGQVLKETQLEPQYLKLEITESAIMENVESVATILKDLRTLGIQMSIDDFGTGYSSLSYLHRLPLNTLKVDRSFVTQIDEGNENLEIVRAIITLAHSLSMDVVAEGIETANQLMHFRGLQCEYAQGHLFAAAADKDTIENIIMQNPQW
ncbi:MAG: EAL domain-containing protein [Abitibacteriaceae bacterium]|nr:EAL domain-containing protein [Abditibacteriaceae bacterium]